MNINAAYDSMFHEWPFNNLDKVILTAEHNGKEVGSKGTVDLSKPAYFWVMWENGTYSSFSKLQMNKLIKVN